ncbi:ribosomal protein S27AE [Amycolatopsis bartoniae]|nr:glycosyltransferase family 4 protein [Amycolatopsis bartoniae]MBB2938688.1 ribosomal protein S27AE [Amycolatopsis bartoniae]TVT11525.1 glycosyltransferase family 4 protein [Amycolatopsis bartoniae]
MAEEHRTEGGDPVCWLARVCPECGLFAEDDEAVTCARCGARLRDDE